MLSSDWAQPLSALAGTCAAASSLPQLYEAVRQGLPRQRRLDAYQAFGLALRLVANIGWLLVGICLDNGWLALAGLFQIASQAVVLAALFKASADP